MENSLYYYENLYIYLKKNFADLKIDLVYDSYVDDYEIIVKGNRLLLSIKYDDFDNLSIISYGSRRLDSSSLLLFSKYCKGFLYSKDNIKKDGKNIGMLYKFNNLEHYDNKIKRKKL